MTNSRIQTESAHRLSKSVTELLRAQPFFGSLALRLPLRMDNSRTTLASDGNEIRYSPEWIAQTPADQIQTAIARIVLACALKHHTRRAERDPQRWQHASQLTTHALLRDAGFTLPPDAEAWDGLSVEEAYNRLPDPQGNQPDQNTPPDASPDAGDGTPDPSSDPGSSNDDDAGDDDPNDDSANSENPEDSQNSDDAQNPEDSQNPGPDPQSPTSFDPSGTGEIMDAETRAPGQTDPDSPTLDIDLEEQNWDEAMHQALNLAKTQGKIPGAVSDAIESAHTSVLDWPSLLRRYMNDATHRDYSWSKPNRRFIDSGLYLPSIHSEGFANIVIIIDTSGSLPADILAAFWSEIRDIAIELHPETIHILQVDAAVQDVAEYAPEDLPEKIVIKGRGGTDFRPGFEWIETHQLDPRCCIYFTDMECDSYPDHEPPYPVIFCNWSTIPQPNMIQPWGERIDIAQ